MAELWRKSATPQKNVKCPEHREGGTRAELYFAGVRKSGGSLVRRNCGGSRLAPETGTRTEVRWSFAH
jgi:hypothetical protein